MFGNFCSCAQAYPREQYRVTSRDSERGRGREAFGHLLDVQTTALLHTSQLESTVWLESKDECGAGFRRFLYPFLELIVVYCVLRYMEKGWEYLGEDFGVSFSRLCIETFRAVLALLHRCSTQHATNRYPKRNIFRNSTRSQNAHALVNCPSTRQKTFYPFQLTLSPSF
jgi:hypothetical protein